MPLRCPLALVLGVAAAQVLLPEGELDLERPKKRLAKLDLTNVRLPEEDSLQQVVSEAQKPSAYMLRFASQTRFTASWSEIPGKKPDTFSGGMSPAIESVELVHPPPAINSHDLHARAVCNCK